MGTSQSFISEKWNEMSKEETLSWSQEALHNYLADQLYYNN